MIAARRSEWRSSKRWIERIIRAPFVGPIPVTGNRAAAAMVVLAVAGSSLVACSPGTTSGYELTVPVLWASSAGGSDEAGVEPATVWAGQDDQAGYSIDLADLSDSGAGRAWTAATSCAAAIGTLYSGLNPSTVGLRFTVTGPIDGPSAGAALTVGVVAALRQQALDPSVTMTGTISASGLIGAVSAIPDKIRAAAAGGYKTVLVPAIAVEEQAQPSGSVVDLGSSLGVTVVPIRTLSQAYQRFTGTQLFDSSAGSTLPLQSPETIVVSTANAGAAVAKLGKAARRPAVTTSPEAALISRLLEDAQRALGSGDVDLAYARAGEGLKRSARVSGRRKVESHLQRLGNARTRQKLLANTQQLLSRATDQLSEQATRANVGLAVSLPAPTANALIVQSIAELKSIAIALTGPSTEAADALVGVGAILGDIANTLATANPNGIAIAQTESATPVADQAMVSEFMSGYSYFFATAANANSDYFTSVLGYAVAADQQPPGDMRVLIEYLRQEAASTGTAVQQLSVESMQMAAALAYFVKSTMLIADYQGLRIRGSGLGADPFVAQDLKVALAARADADLMTRTQIAQTAAAGSSVALAGWLVRIASQPNVVTASTAVEAASLASDLTVLSYANLNALVLSAAAAK